MRSFNFSLRCCVSPPICQALAADALGNRSGALGIIEAGLFPLTVHTDAGFAVVVAEVKFRGVALQMLRANVVERADDAALEDREKAFNRVRVNVASDVVSFGVGDMAVTRKMLVNALIARKFIGHDGCRGLDLSLKDRLQGSAVNRCNMVRAHIPAALHQRENGLFADAAGASPRPVEVQGLPRTVYGNGRNGL